MRRVMLLAMTLAVGAGAQGDLSLHVAISKRIPCEGDTVRLAAHTDDWAGVGGDRDVRFSVEIDGEQRPLGKAILAQNPARPFDPSVEWSPQTDGLHRVIARVEGMDLVAKLLVPVVAQDVYFCWYGRTRPEVEWITHHLTAASSEIDALHARGAMALKHVGGVSYLGGSRWEDIPRDIDPREFVPRVVRDYTDIDPWDGIAIDELGMWDQHPEQTKLATAFCEVLRQARAARPDSFIAAWQFAALTPLECNMFRDTADLVMCEVYQNYFRAWYDQHAFHEFLRQRIDMARRMMVIKKTIVGLSISTDYGGVTPEELEDQIRYIRATGPEMRGLAFFTTSRCDDEVLECANDCCYRYWIKPAVGLFSGADLTLSDYSPQDHGIARLHATVHNVGGMGARNVGVRFWDGDPANGGEQIGGIQTIAHLPAARWIDPQARDDRSIEPPEIMRREGFGMVTVSVPWRARRGPHELWAEIIPDPQYTTIRAFEHKRITVR